MARGVRRRGYHAVSGVEPSSSSSSSTPPAPIDDSDQEDSFEPESDLAQRPLLNDNMVGTTPDTGGAVAIPFVGKGARLDLKSRANRYRWLCIFICSFSGDGWTYESSVMSAIISLPGKLRSQVVD